MLAANDNQCGVSAGREMTEQEKMEERAKEVKKLSLRELSRKIPEGFHVFGGLNRAQLINECTSKMYTIQYFEHELHRKNDEIRERNRERSHILDTRDALHKEVAQLKEKLETVTNLLEAQIVAHHLTLKTFRGAKC